MTRRRIDPDALTRPAVITERPASQDGRRLIDAAMTEKQWMRQVIDTARLLGFEVFHAHDSRKSEPGWPDLFCVRKAPMIGQPSTILVAELKTERGVVSAAQQRWLDLFASAGVPTFVWRPSDWGDVLTVLKGDGEGQPEG